MRGLSSIISRRWISRSASVAMTSLRARKRQRQRESCPLPETGAGRMQRAADLSGGERAAVQAKAMAVDTRGETVAEDALEILWRDADAGVDDRHHDGGSIGTDAHRDALIAAVHLGASVLGIADHINQYLQHLVLIHLYERHLCEVAHDRHAVAAESAFVHAQAVLDQQAHVERVGNAAALRIALLHGDDFLDVLDVGAQR